MDDYDYCEECGTEFYDDIIEWCDDHVPKFCPNCGAEMRDCTTCKHGYKSLSSDPCVDCDHKFNKLEKKDGKAD